jgi:hypothetical protein
MHGPISEPKKIEAIKAKGVRRIARENKAAVGTVLRVKEPINREE